MKIIAEKARGNKTPGVIDAIYIRINNSLLITWVLG